MYLINKYDKSIMQVETSWELSCPNCGKDYLDILYVPDWGKHICAECLTEESEQYNMTFVDDGE